MLGATLASRTARLQRGSVLVCSPFFPAENAVEIDVKTPSNPPNFRQQHETASKVCDLVSD